MNRINWLRLAEARRGGARRTRSGRSELFDLGVFPEAQRYDFDFALCPAHEGWRQYDTTYDAPHFGIWVHEQHRLVVTLCEGELSLVRSPDRESFQLELASMAECYGDPPPAFTVIDEHGGVTRYYDDRPTGEGVDP